MTSSAALHLAGGVGEHLAVLGGDHRGELVAAGVDQLAEGEQHRGPPGQRRVPPARARPGRGGRDRDVDVGRRGEAPPAPRTSTGRRVEHLAAARPAPVDHACRRRSGSPWRSLAPPRRRIASTRMPSPSRASSSVRVSGGPIRITLPYRPPLPTSRPPARHSSNTRAVSGRRPGSAVPGSDELDARASAPCRGPRPRVGLVAGGRAARRQDRADPGRVGLQVVVEQVVEHRVAGGRRDRVAAEGGERDRRHRSPCTSARPTTPARAKPLPMPLAKVSRSGTTPCAW